jgi:hypothetical protein
MLAKTKHKKLWKFYWNPFCCLGRVNHPPSKKISGFNKIWYGTYFYTPRYPAGGGYIVYARLSVSASLLYCIALYDNCIALNDKVQKWRNFSKNC